MITGYRIPGSTRGQVLTLPDDCHGRIGELDAHAIAEQLRRETGQEPAWQRVRAKLIRLARTRGGAL